MNREEFIVKIAEYVKKYAPLYGIKVNSPIIAQAILESAFGMSELAVNACNYFGLKYRANRCPSASGTYVKVGSEQNADGSYVSSTMLWFKFENMETGVKGYFDFINTSNYVNLKGVTDPKTYLENIKADGYATSIHYVTNLINVIDKYDLRKYDKEANKVLKIAIDAGHGIKTAGKRCMKKLDPNETREWFLNNRIASKLETLLKSYNCEIIRVDDKTGKTDVSLADRVNKANSWGANVYLSIHHDAGARGGSAGGTTVYYYSNASERLDQARTLYNAVIAQTGLKGNRSSSVKKYPFYVIKNTKMPSFLIENGFMDSSIDVPIILSEKHANNTANGLLDFIVNYFGLGENSNIVITPTENSFKVRIAVNELNYRSGAGITNPVRGVVRKGEVYTIVQTSGSWGKLKSGAGWINISSKYVTRL